jgi:heavy metal sensor kinase
VSLRARLTLWYTAAVGAVLVLLGAVALALLDRGLRANVDASLETVARTVGSEVREPGPVGVLDDMLAALLGPAMADRFFQLRGPRGEPDPRGRVPLPLSETARRNVERGAGTFETVTVPGIAGPVRVLTSPVTDPGGRLVRVVQVAMPLAGVDAARRRFLFTLLGLAPLALGAVAAGGWLVASRALAPVDAMVATARRIGAEDLSGRIETERREDELGRLASVLNDMLARLERAFATAREFSADAAHELRTPLTILKGEIEVALRAVRSPPEYRATLESCAEEVDRLAALVEDLLLLARTDAGVVPRPTERVNLADVLGDVAPALHALAERAGTRVVLRAERDVPVRGSAPALFRVILNLVDNAIRHGAVGGPVEIDLARRDGDAVLEIRDHGPGIDPAERERIFARFYRADPARERGGTGLGLPLVRSLVLLHGGRIDVESAPGGGTVFRVRVPLGRD